MRVAIDVRVQMSEWSAAKAVRAVEAAAARDRTCGSQRRREEGRGAESNAVSDKNVSE